MRRGVASEALHEQRLQRRLVFRAQRVRLEARVILETWNAQRRSDILHGIGLEGADHYQCAVCRFEHTRERHRAPIELIATHQLRGRFLGLRSDHGVEQRHVELLSPPRLFPRQVFSRVPVSSRHFLSFGLEPALIVLS